MDKNWREFVFVPDTMDPHLVADADDIECQGVYFLRNPQGRLQYVGLSRDIGVRVQQHRDAGRIHFPVFSWIEVPAKSVAAMFIKDIEAAYIRALDPPCNRHPGTTAWSGTRRMAKVIRRLWLRYRSDRSE